MTDPVELQRQITRAALAALDEYDFALAGSGAIREHGFIDRLSHDVDLFTPFVSNDVFDAGIDTVRKALTRDGFTVDVVRREPSFAQLRVTTAAGEEVDVDLAVDWRARRPVSLDVGLVLDVHDAVASKVGAVYSRLEARDFIDVDAIRTSGRFTDQELLDLAADRDDGFVPRIYGTQLRQLTRIPDERFAEYGVIASDLAALRTRFAGWATTLSDTSSGSTPSATTPGDSLARRGTQKDPWPTDASTHPAPGTAPRADRPRLA